ncbi:MAG: hypothetical protein V3W41_09100 [Planctomycetota bacterium]
MKNALASRLPIISALAGWLNREQLRILNCLKEENQVLKEQLGTKSLRLTNDLRRRLAAKGWDIGRRLLGEYATVVMPDPLLRWHRKLISQEWTNAAGGGRPGANK